MKRALFIFPLLALMACEPPVLKGTRRGELVVAVDGSGADAGVTSSYDVGNVTVGQTKEIVVRATNVGIDALTFTGASLGSSGNGSWFVRSANSVMLSPGSSVTATVTFAPAAAGAQTTQVTFGHDADAPFPSVSLTGTGI